MHDKNGTPLKKGDKVLIEAEITELNAGEDYCNVSVQTVAGRRPDGQKERISAINTGVLTLLERAKSTAVVLCIAALLLLSGCGRTPAEKDAGKLKREALLNYAENQGVLHRAEQEGFRAEAQAHAKTKWLWDLEKLKEKADANGKVDANDARTWVLKVTAELEQNYAKADEKVKAVQAEIKRADADLRTVLELDEFLQKVQDSGVSPDMVSKAGEAIGDILRKR